MQKLLRLVRIPLKDGSELEQIYYRGLLVEREENPVMWALRIEDKNKDGVEDGEEGEVTLAVLDNLYFSAVDELSELRRLLAGKDAYNQIEALCYSVGEVA